MMPDPPLYVPFGSPPIEVRVNATPSTQAWPIDVQELKPAQRLVLSLAHADKGILMLYDEQAATLYPVLGQGFTDEECRKFGSHSVNSDGPFAKAIVGHKRVRVRNAWQDRDAMHTVARTLGFRHLEILPFFKNDGTVLGTLNLAFRSGHGSPRSAGKLEGLLADLVAVAVGHAQRRAAAEHAYERGDRSNADKIQLLARLSHELRTPLQSISGYVDLMMVNDK
jgi:signal transduction histidine kinase